MSNQTAGKIAEFIAPYIGMSYPNDENRIFENLSLVQDEIWSSGKFYGSTKYFYAPIRSDNTIITPHGYNVLLGCNINFKSVNINGTSAIFHKNGPSETPLAENGFSKDVYHLGDSPVMFQPNGSWCKPCGPNKGKVDFYISVCGGDCEINKKTLVSSLGRNGKPIYTYFKEETGDKPIVCEDRDLIVEEIKYNEGVMYDVVGQHVNHKDIIVGDIYNIIKDPTISPVEYYLVNKETGVGTLMARLEPYETVSNYKIYQISKSCVRNNCVLGLFKRSKPVDIVDPSQILISNNKSAILSIAKGVHKKFAEDNIQLGETFIMGGINLLAKEVREQKPNSTARLQIDSLRDFSKIKNIR